MYIKKEGFTSKKEGFIQLWKKEGNVHKKRRFYSVLKKKKVERKKKEKRRKCTHPNLPPFYCGIVRKTSWVLVGFELTSFCVQR